MENNISPTIAKPAKDSKNYAAASQNTRNNVTDVMVMLASADKDAGEKVFRRCKSCHSTNNGGKNKIGPNLWDVVERSKASASNYRFSKALGNLGGNWSYQDLDGFLINPKDFVKGTKMSFAGIKNAKDRADLIIYLRSLSDQPKPLP
jgi:cytochrome c